MSPSRLVLVLLFAFGSNLARAQQTATTSPPAASTEGAFFLQKALLALAPSTPTTDVTLSGTVRRIAGSDDESGTVVLRALAGTGSRLDLTLPSGTRSEIRNTSSVPISGSWSSADGISHPIVQYNLVADPSWSPAFPVASFVASQSAVLTNLGQETKNGSAVIHIAASLQFPGRSAKSATFLNHLSETQIYLDAATFLPVAVGFNIHPDGNSSIDIPVEMDYSNYQSVNGAQIPFRVQKFINNSLALDLQFDSATVNSGLSATTFTVGAGL
jgi:hypothetical protein